MSRGPRAVCALLVCAAAFAGCADEPSSDAPSAADVERDLARSPAPLASLHRQANQLLDGGADAFKRRIASLRGHPVVVNKWASWCGPCRAEFPFFQRLSVERGRKIAFIGVNSNDNDGAARKFLERYPISYPSYKDPDTKIAQVFNAVVAFPTTVFYDARGKLAFIHQGEYRTRQDLSRDIDRYGR
jgi:cytochrome c biogenesis protein CcmG, thiol:disulfide interchange protein DsbE